MYRYIEIIYLGHNLAKVKLLITIFDFTVRLITVCKKTNIQLLKSGSKKVIYFFTFSTQLTN